MQVEDQQRDGDRHHPVAETLEAMLAHPATLLMQPGPGEPNPALGSAIGSVRVEPQ